MNKHNFLRLLIVVVAVKFFLLSYHDFTSIALEFLTFLAAIGFTYSPKK